MKTIYHMQALYLLIILMLHAACHLDEPQPIITRTFDLQGFDRIELGDAFRIDIAKGPVFRVTAEGRQSDILDLELLVVNGTLTGHYLPNRNTHGRSSLYIELPELTNAHLYGASETFLRGFHNAPSHMAVEVDGNSELQADISCKRLTLKVSGNSEVYLTGQAESLDAEVSGKSKLLAEPFPVYICRTAISGLSRASVFTRNILQGSVDGKSRLTYFGQPARVDVAVAGDSELIKK